MSLDFAQHRDFFVLDGKTLTSGGSLNVSNGVLAIVDNKEISQNGRKVVSSFSGLSKDKDFQILLGKIDSPVTKSTTNKPYESLPFKLSEVLDLKVVAPQTKGIKVDDFIIGFNGKAGTELTIKQNSSSSIEVTLCGAGMEHLGYNSGEYTAVVNMQKPYTDEDGNPIGEDAKTMQEIVENAVAEFNRMTLLGGAPITDYVEAIPVNSENAALLGTTDFSFYSLTITDNGDQTALARVQAQYPTYKVVKTDRLGEEQSVYTIIAPTGTSLASYVKSLSQTLKGCEECPAGYSELAAGVVYSITIEDDGADLSTTIDDVPGFVATTAIKIGTSTNGVGTYTVVVDNALTSAEITAFKAASAVKSTAVFDIAGDVKALCENNTTTTTAWATGSTCSAKSDIYRITLADDECGSDILSKLQADYPELSIAVDTVNSSRTITLTGTSGTANVAVNGVNYLATFTTDLATTASNFVTAHAATILAATGAVVTASTGTIIIVDAADSYPVVTIANATTDLAGTISAIVGVGAEVSGLCQTTYRTNVLSNIVCDECSEEFRALFTTKAPHNFGIVSWEAKAKTFSATAKMGIRFRAKEFVMSGTEAFRDDMPFYATSTRLKIAGGQPKFIAESWANQDRPYKLTVLSIASEPEALGGHLWEREDASRFYFDGLPRFKGNNYGKFLWGQETRLKGLSQYVDYQLTVQPKKYYQLTPHSSEMITYHIIVPLGNHENVEGLLNNLATSAGIPAVQAFAK
jgi:hypothetical protein